MDKKRLFILISSVVVLLLIAGLFLFLFFNRDTAKPVETPVEDIVKGEEEHDFREQDFDENMATNQINADSETIEDEERKKMLEEQKRLDEEAKKLEEENKVVVTENDKSIIKSYGDIKVTRTGGTVGNDLAEVDKLRKESGGVSIDKDLSQIDDIKTVPFTKETRPTNKSLVTNLNSKLDFATTDFSTYVFDKSSDEDILVFTEIKSSTASKSNYDYFDNNVKIGTDYFNKSDANKEDILKMLTDIGYDLTMEELKALVENSIKLDGEDLHVIRNYKAHIMFDFIKIMYVK